MLIITNKQMKALDDIFFNRFVEDAYSDIMLNYPELCTTEKELRLIIHKQGRRAIDQFDMQTIKWVFHFVRLSLVHKTLLQNKYPEYIEEILTWPDRKEKRKIEMLINKLEA